jgi:hypothetical protein
MFHSTRSLAVLTVLFVPAALLQASSDVEFNRDVRPILSDKCYLCHGPDAKAKHIPLRLDHEDTAKAALPDGKRAVAEGHPEESEMIHRITAPNPGMRMPPSYSGLKLTGEQIATLRTWIAQGAKWQKHWAFIPPVRPPLPVVKDASWARNPIDNFVLARLEREGLATAPEADRATLLRRVTLDLTGLPPTPAELDAFLNDKSPAAYEKVVDRLLASPRYGERMAYTWLEAARFADTNGYQYDGGRDMWRWRDWVINAFNRNEPYNQFVLEQLAGDMLPNATLDQKIASGFNRNHRINTEDGIIPEEYAVEYVIDRVDTTSSAFLGVTLGCARCHNHKYDPFTQKEFYQIYAYFNNVPELGRGMKYGNSPPVIAAPTPRQQAALHGLDERMQLIKGDLRQHAKVLDHAQTSWERQLREDVPQFWAPSRDLVASFTFDKKEGLQPSGGEVPFVRSNLGRAVSFDGKAYLNTGIVPKLDVDDAFTISTWIYSDAPDGSIVTQMVDSPKGKGYGVHADHGKVQVDLTGVWESDALRVETEDTLAAQRWHHIAVTYDGSKTAEGLHVFVDGESSKLKVLADTLYRPYRNAGKGFEQPLRIGAGWGPERRFRGQIDDTYLYSRVLSGDELLALGVGESIATLAHKPAAERTQVERQALRWSFLDSAAPPRFGEDWRNLSTLKEDEEKLKRTFPTVMVMQEMPTPRQTHLLARGAYDMPGEVVQPGVPAVLPALRAGVPNNRLGFARWVADPGNPLTARVMVNRFWQMYFGTGIVKTVEDFGSQGEWPSHPELLDYLATKFVRSGWDMKAMQKLIVTSATYRQSSKANPELLARDPENRLLARGPRIRLPAEMVRDQTLAVAGLLVEKIGGPSVKPYQPAGLWKEISMQGLDYDQGHGEDLYRRSLYTYWKRTVAPPMMTSFDAATRENCEVRASRTDTPLQALNLMDGEQFLEAARFLGQRMMKEGGSDADSRLRYGFRLALERFPSAAELDVLRRSLRFHMDYFSNPQRAKEYLAVGDSPSDPKLNPTELAAYASVGSLLFNLDETITKE